MMYKHTGTRFHFVPQTIGAIPGLTGIRSLLNAVFKRASFLSSFILLASMLIGAVLIVQAIGAMAALPAKFLIGFILGIAFLILAILLPDRERTGLFLCALFSGINYIRFVWNPNYQGGHWGGATDQPEFRLIDIGITWIVLCALVKISIHKTSFPRFGFFETAIVLMCVISSFSILNVEHSNQYYFIFELMKYIKYVGFYFALRVLFQSEKNRDILLFSYLVPIILQLPVAVYQVLTEKSIPIISNFVLHDTIAGVTVRRAGGLLGATNAFGLFLLAPISFTVSYCLTPEHPRSHRLYALAILAVCIVSLYLSMSRNSIVCAIVVLAVLLLLRQKKKPFKTRAVYAGIVLLISALLTAAFIWTTSKTFQYRMKQNTVTVRGKLYDVAVKMIVAHPLAGVGLNTFEEVIDRYDVDNVSNSFPEAVHNIFALTAAETGLPSLVCLLCIIGIFTWRTIRVYACHKDRWLATAVAALIPALILYSCFDHAQRNELPLTQLCIVAALLGSMFFDTVATRTFDTKTVSSQGL